MHASATPLSHPLPQFRRDLWASLDGTWRVEVGGRTREIVVPYTFEALRSGIGAGKEIHEQLRYRRRFHVPDEWKERTLLRFGAVDWRATVSLDGRVLGSHEGGYAHFTVDAGALEPGSEHELVVEVYDPAADAFGQAKGKQRGSHDIWYTRTTGIWRSVWIEAVPEEYLHEVALLALPDGTVTADGAPVLHVDAPRLWSPEDPFLYDVELRHGDDVVHSYAGFRTIERRGRELMLNGEPLRIAGVLDQGYWPGGVCTATDEELRADVESAKKLGFNLARKHVKIEDPRWYAWCDRLGLLVAQDMPSSHSLVTPEAREQFMQEWLEIVAQLRAHPSVIIWIPINEDWGEPPPEFQGELVRATREVDPTRLVIDASGWKQLDDTDLVDVHDYGRELTHHRGKRDDIPLWIGELGGLSLGTGDFVYRHVDDLADAYRKVIEQIPGDVAGFCWTQLTDVEQEQNGLLTDERRPKAEQAAIRAVNEEFVRRA